MSDEMKVKGDSVSKTAIRRFSSNVQNENQRLYEKVRMRFSSVNLKPDNDTIKTTKLVALANVT